MLQSNAFGLLLVVGLAGICQVATFGTMPGNWKDMSVSARGESGSQGQPDVIVHDDNFCNNLPGMQRTRTHAEAGTNAAQGGTTWCSDITSEEECGYGVTSYRVSSSANDKYDPCWWDADFSDNKFPNGKCKMTKDTYTCGEQCFPTAQSTEEETVGDTKYIECGGVSVPVSGDENWETSCVCVNIWEDGEVKRRCAISRFDVSTRRRLDARRLDFASDCYAQSTTGVTTSGPGNYVTTTTYECKPTRNQANEDVCKCNNKSVVTLPEEDIPDEDKLTNEELYQNENIAADASCQKNGQVSPYYWGP